MAPELYCIQLQGLSMNLIKPAEIFHQENRLYCNRSHLNRNQFWVILDPYRLPAVKKQNLYVNFGTLSFLRGL